MANIVPISNKDFADKRWHRFKLMGFAEKDTIAPLTAREASRAILSMPIGFVKSNGQYSLIALQGLETKRNLLVDPGGRWRGGYIPHHYFCYPFQMRMNQDGNLILCIDAESELVTSSDDDDAERFYDEGGEPTKLVSDVVEFLSSHISQLESTARICMLLAEYRLIKPWPLKVDTNQGEIAIEALYCIDEERLNNLSATALKELRNGDGITLAYAQLFSMLNVNLLIEQINNSAGGGKDSFLQQPEIDFENPDSGGTISFENL